MNYFFIVVAVLFILWICNMIRKKDFSEKESVFWFFGALITLVFAIFPQLLIAAADLLGVDYAPSLLFLIAIFFLLLINFRNTRKIVKQSEKITELAQQCSILKHEIHEIEERKEP